LGGGIVKIRKSSSGYQERGSLFLSLLFIGALISILGSPFANYPVIYSRLLQLATPLCLFFFLANAPYPKELLFKICSRTIFITALIQAGLGIVQYFQQSSLGLRILGEQPLFCRIVVSKGHRWLLDSWFDRTADGEQIYRAMGTLSHPNVLGGLLVFSLFITTYLFFEHRRWRLWFVAPYLVQVFALGITYSRSAIYAYAMGSLIWLIWMSRRQKAAMLSSIILMVGSCSIVGVLLQEQILSRGGIINYTKTSRDSDEERLFYQKIAFRMIEKHPLIGVGYQQFSPQAPQYLPPGDESTPTPACAHNIYLLIASEMGLFALAIFLFWVGLMLWAGWRSISAIPETGLLWSAFIGFLLIGCCDFYPFVVQQGKILFFGLAGLLARFGRFEKKTMSFDQEKEACECINGQPAAER
jgi:O-antigen ligase